MKIEMDAVRPDPVAPLEEYRLFLALLPIRLHLDQQHIDFCINFFSPCAGPIVPPHSGLVDDSLYPSAGSSINSVPSFESGNPDTANDAFLPYFQICELQPLSIRLDYLPRHIDLVALREGNYAELLNLVSWKVLLFNWNCNCHLSHHNTHLL
jgi:autophagy-related protein 2